MPQKSPSRTDIKREIAARSYWHYRQIIRPKMLIGWWQRDCAAHLQQFYNDMVAGKRPKLAISSPPQHGKSEQAQDFISWVSGKNPDIRTIFTTFSDRLGVKTNRNLQRTYTEPTYNEIFPETSINADNAVTLAGRPLRNNEILEYVNHEGYFRNTTVLGPITGEGLDLGIIDDPIKGREAAASKTIRDKTWDWFTDDFFSRFSENAGMLIIMTRWHLDDPLGRMKATFPDLKIVSYKAIATEDEEHRKAGEPLFPELKSLDFLLERKGAMLNARWEALYQQNPTIESGIMFRWEALEIIPVLPADIVQVVRYWDKAGTKGGGCYTAGVKMARTSSGLYIVLSVIRGQWGAVEREKVIQQTAQLDGPGVAIWVEQEPGSGGKESAEATIRSLSGFTCKAERPTGDKVLRAEPYAVQVDAGNVKLLKGEWNQAYIDEVSTFPSGEYKDQIDASSGAFGKLCGPKVDIW